jgi:hypothetical protein
MIGAFHSRLRVTEDQTARYLAALSNPSIHVLAHPRGRIFNFRRLCSSDFQQPPNTTPRRRSVLSRDNSRNVLFRKKSRRGLRIFRRRNDLVTAASARTLRIRLLATNATPNRLPG